MKFLSQADPEIYAAAKNELARQREGLEMIASENFVSPAVLEAMGTVFTNKYSEGLPGHRYYAGNEFVDNCENLAIARAKPLFGAEHVNVQPHSGSQANAESYFALMNLGDTMLGMSLDQGGHLTHGSPVNFSGNFYKVISYGLKADGMIDYDQVLSLAKEYRPKVILCGASAYPRVIDFARFKEIADAVGAYLMADIAHIAGLVAAKIHPDAIPYCDIVTTTTHKTLRGPRGGMIMSKVTDRLRPDDKKNLAQKIDSAVFPGMQGGPLDHIIAAKAVAFKEALGPSFIEYQKQIVANAKILAETLLANGIDLVTGGTDNHLILVNLVNLNIAGQAASDALEAVNIHANKNAVPNDPRKPWDPSGIRLGTPALTTRGMKEDDMRVIGQTIAKVLKNIGEEKVTEDARGVVKELTERYPLYPELEY